MANCYRGLKRYNESFSILKRLYDTKNNKRKDVERNMIQQQNNDLNHNYNYEGNNIITMEMNSLYISNSLAIAYIDQFQYDAALEILSKAMQATLEEWSPLHPIYSVLTNNCGIANLLLGNFFESGNKLTESLDNRTRVYGVGSEEVYLALKNLSLIFYEQKLQLLSSSRKLSQKQQVTRDSKIEENKVSFNLLLNASNVIQSSWSSYIEDYQSKAAPGDKSKN
jgi:tetratricopeptide (TPR) repeat protein